MDGNIFPPSSRKIPVFARGFYITDTEDRVVVPETYEKVQLSDTWTYFHDFLTTPAVARDGSSFLVLHGNYESLLQVDHAQVTEVALQKFMENREEFYEFLDDLSGRWAIFASVDGRELEAFHDAFGTRTVYYDEKSCDIASHVEFIARNHAYKPIAADAYYQTVSANFDQTKYQNIVALIPNHRLVVKSGEAKTKRYWPRYENPYTHLSHEEKVSLILSKWDSVVQKYSQDYDSLVFSLSGGEDSRANLAMAMPYIDGFEFFTYATHRTDGETYWYESIRKDYEISQQVVDVVNVNHRFMFREESSLDSEPTLKRIVDINTSGQHGKWLLPLYRKEFPGMTHLHMRGTLFEIGKAIYHDSKDKGDLSDVRRLFDSHSRKSRQPREIKARFFDEKIERLELNPEDYLSYLPSDIFYWEMRQGRWFSETLNESDLAFDSFVPINNRRLVMLLMSFTLSERQGSFIFNEIINRTCPILNFIGKNNVKNLYEQVRDGETPSLYSIPRVVSMEYAANGSQYKETEIPEKDGVLVVPRGRFFEGNRVTARYTAKERLERAVVTWISPYQKPSGRGIFAYHVYKNGVHIYSQDGAETSEQMEIGVGELVSGDNVELEIKVLKTQQSKSWSDASRIESFNVVSL